MSSVPPLRPWLRVPVALSARGRYESRITSGLRQREAGAGGGSSLRGMTELPARLTAVTLGARDLPGLRRFYAGLGWTQVPESSDEWAGFLLGGTLLSLYPMD